MGLPETIGLHVLCDYYGCDLSQFCPTQDSVQTKIAAVISLISEEGLTPLGKSLHYFGPGALSACINLSESHLNFHTWPELGYVSLDIFCCSKRPDLRAFLEGLASTFGDNLFNADSHEIQVITRGRGVVSHLNAVSEPVQL